MRRRLAASHPAAAELIPHEPLLVNRELTRQITMKTVFRLLSVAALLALAACVTVPSGPSMMSLPGSGKSFDQFRADDYDCRQYASVQAGGTTPNQAAVNSGVTSAAVGTAVGAAAGALIDGRSGAGVGAGVGLLTGSLAGSGAANTSSYGLQQRYDIGYTQCMYAKGHKVPVSGRFTSSSEQPAQRYSAPPPPPPPPPYR
jgi:outer membrane lipoprotein SlyB